MAENKNFWEKLKGLVDTKLEEEKPTEDVKLEEAPEVKLMQENTVDGVVLEAEIFEAGQPIFIVNEEDRIPLPVGNYPMESGMVLVVEEEGIIASMGEAVAEEEEEMSSEFVTIEQFNTAIDEIKEMFSKELEAGKEKVEELSKEKTELEEQLKAPAVAPLKKAPVEMAVVQPKNAKERILQSLRK